MSRRALIKLGLLGMSATTLAGIDALVWAPKRIAEAAPNAAAFPDIQFDIGNFIGPAETLSGVLVRFGPVYTVFLTARLNRTPTKGDQRVLTNALNKIETVFPYSPAGIFTIVSYGLPYFRRLPGGLSGNLVSSHMPRLLSDTSRYALEEAVPSPTDVTSGGGITKATFNVPVVIESNDVLLSFRSDTLSNIQNVISWLQGSNNLNGSTVASPAFSDLFTFTSMRTMFAQMSLPHFIAQEIIFHTRHASIQTLLCGWGSPISRLRPVGLQRSQRSRAIARHVLPTRPVLATLPMVQFNMLRMLSRT